MTSLLNRLFGRVKSGSGVTAKNRLHFVLQHDRINLPPERADEMKKEILAVIVKYLAVDQNRVEIALEQRDRSHSKLVAEIPIVSQKPPSEAEPPERVADDTPRAESNGVDKADRTDTKDEDEDAAAQDSQIDDTTEEASDSEPDDKDDKR